MNENKTTFLARALPSGSGGLRLNIKKDNIEDINIQEQDLLEVTLSIRKKYEIIETTTDNRGKSDERKIQIRENPETIEIE